MSPGSGAAASVSVMKPRLVDVAALAGVSMKTVSNVVNAAPHVREHTRQRVLAAIDELGYQPNQAARNLARGRSGVIALAIPHLDRPYFASLAARLLEAAELVGWTVQIRQTGGEREAELAALQGPHPTRLDGLVLNPVSLTAQDLQGADPALALVLLGEEVPSGHPGHHVAIDNRAAGRLATEHLIAAGARRILALAPGHGTGTDRIGGYRDALAAAGIGVDEDLVLASGGVRGEDAEQILGGWLDSGATVPDAIFGGTDWLAMGAIRALQLRGLQVPLDVLVVGFDDIPYDLATLPTLTSVAPDRSALAREAIRALGEHRPGLEPQHVEVEFELVVRESSVRPPR